MDLFIYFFAEYMVGICYIIKGSSSQIYYDFVNILLLN